MPVDIDLFVIFGRDPDAANSLRTLLNDYGARTHTLARERKLGRPVPIELERVVRSCDAAVVLATPDDVGRLASDADLAPRARENIWIELGWFWAELGLERTLLITAAKVQPPSDLSSIFRLVYDDDPFEVRAEIREWFDTLSEDRPGDSVDFLRSSIDSGHRNADYQFIHQEAKRDLLVTGIGMMNVRQDIPQLMSRLEVDKDLSLRFIIPSDRVIGLHESEQLAPYRSTGSDVEVFRQDLRLEVHRRGLVDRVTLIRYNRVMTFVVTVADLGRIGSTMLVELPLEASQHGLVERPRFMLRRRVPGGLYDRFASAILGMVSGPDSAEESLE